MSEDLNLSVDCKKVIGKRNSIEFPFIQLLPLKEWLFERKKIPKDWPKKHKALQLKMSKIVEKDIVQYKHISEYLAHQRESSPYSLIKFLKNPSILAFDYYNLCMVIEKLLQTSEANDKNFFGKYLISITISSKFFKISASPHR